MKLNKAKVFLTEKGYTISRRFKNSIDSKYWLYDIIHPDGTRKSYKSRDVENLANRVFRGI